MILFFSKAIQITFRYGLMNLNLIVNLSECICWFVDVDKTSSSVRSRYSSPAEVVIQATLCRELWLCFCRSPGQEVPWLWWLHLHASPVHSHVSGGVQNGKKSDSDQSFPQWSVPISVIRLGKHGVEPFFIYHFVPLVPVRRAVNHFLL